MDMLIRANVLLLILVMTPLRLLNLPPLRDMKMSLMTATPCSKNESVLGSCRVHGHSRECSTFIRVLHRGWK